MRAYLLLICVTPSLASLAAPAAAAERNMIEFRGKGYLGVVGGKVRVVSAAAPGYYDWSLTRGASDMPIRVLEPAKWKGWLLAYDPEVKDPSKDKAVFLAEELGPGTDWKLAHVEKVNVYTIQVASGKLKGWYLDVEEKGEELKGPKGKPYTAYRVFLSEKPKRLPKVLLTVIAP